MNFRNLTHPRDIIVFLRRISEAMDRQEFTPTRREHFIQDDADTLSQAAKTMEKMFYQEDDDDNE